MHATSQTRKHKIDFQNPIILDNTRYLKELPFRETWAIHSQDEIMNQVHEWNSLPGPYQGLHKLIKNPENGSKKKPKRSPNTKPTRTRQHSYNLRPRL